MPIILLTSKCKRNIVYFSTLSLILALLVILVFFPQEILPAAIRGLEAWLTVVFPALFPFFVISELLMEFGAVHFLSALLEPVMRPLFRLPGSSAMVLAVGYTSGAPIGGVLAARLRKQSLLTQNEAERLVSFTNNASPLFMLSAVSVGFLGKPALGWILVASHYAANLVLGLCLRFLRPATGNIPATPKGVVYQAFYYLNQARREIPGSPGKILGDAVKNSIQIILVIGGFILFFSVIIQALTILGLINVLAKLFGIVLIPLGFDQGLLIPLASGFVEMTIGAKMIADSGAPLAQQLACISMVLGWAGISIHGQVAAMIAETDIRMGLYILTRFFQGVLGALFSYLLFSFFPPTIGAGFQLPVPSTGAILILSLKSMLGILVALILLGLVCLGYQKLAKKT